MEALINLSSAVPAEGGELGGVAVGSPSDLHPTFFGFHVLFSAKSLDPQSSERRRSHQASQPSAFSFASVTRPRHRLQLSRKGSG